MLDDLKQAYLPKTRFPTRAVDREKCKKCLRCVEACPTNGFETDQEGYPAPIGFGGMEQACLNCWNCVAVCPAGAMAVDGVYSVEKGRYKNLLQSRMRFPDPLMLDQEKPYADFAEKLTPTERVIYQRRSNRLFKKKPVPRALLHRILEAGRFAPSAANCQPYCFVVVTNPALIAELESEAMKALRIFKNLYFDKKGKRRLWKNALFSVSSLVMPGKMDPRPFTAMEKAHQCGNAIFWGAPAVIFACKNPRGVSNPDLDIGMATQNMVLAAHSLGLGTCYIGLVIEPLGYSYMAAMREKLGITKPWVPVTSMVVGYPKGKIDGPVKRDTPPVIWKE